MSFGVTLLAGDRVGGLAPFGSPIRRSVSKTKKSGKIVFGGCPEINHHYLERAKKMLFSGDPAGGVPLCHWKRKGAKHGRAIVCVLLKDGPYTHAHTRNIFVVGGAKVSERLSRPMKIRSLRVTVKTNK